MQSIKAVSLFSFLSSRVISFKQFTVSSTATRFSIPITRCATYSSQTPDVPKFIQTTLPRAWESLGLEDLIGNDHEFRKLFCYSLKEFGNGVSEEIKFTADVSLKDKNQKEDGKHQSIKSLLKRYENHRQISGGVIPCFAFAHLIKPIPRKLFESEAFQESLRIGSLIGGIDNDLQSTKKEDGEWNFVTLQQKFGEHSPENAIQLGCIRHKELVESYNEITNKLAQELNEPAILAWCNTVVPTILRGFVSWQSHVKRYENDNDTSLLEILFESDSYHDVDKFGTFEGMNAQLKEDLNRETLHWALELGLIGSVVSRGKFDAIDPALCTLLLYDYYDSQKDIAALHAWTKFFVLLVIIDDLWERPKLHELTKQVMFDCFDTLLIVE